MNENYVIPFGKHKGQTLPDVAEENPPYLMWLNTVAKGDLKKNLEDFLETKYFQDCLVEWEINNEMEYCDQEPYAFDYMWK